MALTIINGNLRSPSGFKVAPQSYISIEKEAIALQDLLKENDCFIGHSVDSLKVLEVMLPKYGYNYHYADDSTMGNNAAFTGYTDLMVDGAPSPHQSDTTLRWLIDRLRS